MSTASNLVLVLVHSLHDLQDRGRGKFPDLRVDGAQDRVLVHDDLRGGQGDQGSARHREMRNEDRDGSLPVRQGVGDLGGGQDQSPGCMDDEVDRGFRVGHLDGPEDFLGIFDVDVPKDRKTEKGHRLLTVHQGDDLGSPEGLEVPERPSPGHFKELSGQDRLHHGEDEKKPEQIPDAHGAPLVSCP